MRGPSRIVAASLLFAGLGGCASSLEGNWSGLLRCGGIDYDFGFLLAEENNQLYLGSGEKYRYFDNLAGQVIEEFDEFDITLERLSLNGEQDLIVIMECTRRDKKIDGLFDENTECLPQQYADWDMHWDGEELMNVLGPDQDCAGDIVKGSDATETEDDE